jgi:hypothetical protein
MASDAVSAGEALKIGYANLKAAINAAQPVKNPELGKRILAFKQDSQKRAPQD